MLQFDSIRGPDSTGVFGVTSGNNVDVLKGDADGYIFTQCDEYKKFEKKVNSAYQIAIGHNRKATIGEIKPENAHPFRSNNIVLVHNGSLRNASTLNKEAEVDSAAIASALAAHDAQKALSLLDGPFALVWYDTQLKTLNLARNAGRPLMLVEYTDLWCISSEAGLPLWLNGRESRKHVTIKEIAVGKIITWNLNKLRIEPSEVAFTEYKWVPPVTTYTHPVVPHHASRVWPSAYGTGPTGTRVLSPESSSLLQRDGGPEDVDEGDPAVSSTKLPQAGDEILVKFDDSKDEPQGVTTFLGHPIISGVLDENIVVRSVKGSPKLANEFTQCLAAHDHFKCKVRACGLYRGVPLLYVSDEIPVPTLFRSLNAQFFTVDQLGPILKDGTCERCLFGVFPHQVEKTIIRRKKASNRWEIICSNCIEHMITHATPKSTATEPVVAAEPTTGILHVVH